MIFGKKKKIDRQKFLRQTREDLLTKLGLPPDTPPDQVVQLLEIKDFMEKLKKTGRNSEM